MLILLGDLTFSEKKERRSVWEGLAREEGRETVVRMKKEEGGGKEGRKEGFEYIQVFINGHY